MCDDQRRPLPSWRRRRPLPVEKPGCLTPGFGPVLGGRLEVAEPVLVLRLQIHEGLDGIAPALRPAVAVVRPAVEHPQLLFFATLAEAALSLGVAESHALMSPIT